ncbi:LacI family DNA-binding transcriptional regulator [Microbacterium sp. CIAB417]|uniref:LacI family DNA-binding transcriptional regulator n=1 Tax=Microbacterium sp. CIAB417 TaxID=2860287 RepID=UPI001FACDD1D|nr:LacI family DNA-binding transcriptional regulator [Microbacterium sp. CIAB417]
MVTMNDVAKRAGVSIATVSFVLSGAKPISAATRERVETAMRELGYRRNPVGAALARGRTNIIALLYPALQRPATGSVMGFFTSAAARAQELGRNLVLWPISNDAGEAAALANTGLVDGVLLMEVQLEDARVEALRPGTTPFALIGRTRDTAGLTFVDVDFEASMSEAVAALDGLGHRRIAFVTGNWGDLHLEDHGAAERSRACFRTEMARRGVRKPLIVPCAENSLDGRRLGRTLITEHPELTALVVMNEHAAPGIVMGLRDAGRRVPDDVSIISIGSSANMAGMADPPLSFMRTPGEELGRLGVDAIIERIENAGAEPPAVLLACEMQPGATLVRVRPGD